MNLVHRVLFVAWRSPSSGSIHPIARLLECEGTPRWEFAYLHGAKKLTEDGSAPLMEFPDCMRVYRSDELFPIFRNRLMPPRRPDYSSYLKRLGLPSTNGDPITILARSAGRRETDKIEVFGFPSFEPRNGNLLYRFFLRGVRHVPGAEERIAALKEGDALTWRRDPNNPVDDLAVIVQGHDRGALGWIPATLLGDFDILARGSSDLRVTVERINLAPAPVHERILCRLETKPFRGFAPFSGPDYEPIPPDATSLHPTLDELVA